ncbi:MAG: hypothetical protein M3R51_01510 [Candidatus Eremiobacteraeota bacterium]|nr:hypothetical protein [Candidatus Eremiobacteraeota bacterium]
MENVDQLKDRARGIVVDQIDRRTTDLGNVVGEHVENLRTMGGTLRDQGQGSTAKLVDAAAERLGSLSTYLTQNDGDRIIHDLEVFARKQAMVTAAVGAVAGFVAARVLRASATERYRSYTGSTAGNSGSAPTTYGAQTYRGDYNEGYDDIPTQ